MNKKFFTKELKVGLFALLILGALYFVVHFLKGSDVFNGTTTYYATFPNVEGLAPSSPVSVLGLKAGAIDQIQFDQNRQLMIVRMRLEKRFNIPIGSVAEIFSADILGGKAVQIHMSENTSSFHQSGDTLHSAIQKDIMSLLTSELIPLKDKLVNILDGLDSALGQLNGVLDTTNVESVNQSLASLEQTLGNLNEFSQTLRQKGPSIDRIVTNVDSLSGKFEGAMAHIDITLANLNALSGELKDANVSKTISELTDLISQLKSPNGSLGQLMYTPELHDNLNRVLSKVDTLVDHISENPKKYLKLSVF